MTARSDNITEPKKHIKDEGVERMQLCISALKTLGASLISGFSFSARPLANGSVITAARVNFVLLCLIARRRGDGGLIWRVAMKTGKYNLQVTRFQKLVSDLVISLLFPESRYKRKLLQENEMCLRNHSCY